MELFYFAVVLLFISSGSPAIAQNSGKETVMSVAAGAPLTVECPLRVEARAEWRLNGSAVPADMTPGERAAPGGRLTARLHAAAARAHHAGVYTCSRERDAHRVRLLLAPAAALAAAEPAAQLTPPPQPAAVADEEDGEPIVVYDINRNLTLDCAMPSADKTLSYVWKKNDVVLEQVAELKGRYKLEEGGAVFSVVGRANEEDYGNYSCALGADERAWRVHGRPAVRLPDNTNVVEGQKIKLQCRVIGKPYPAVSWTYNTSLEANETLSLGEGARDGRVRLEPNEQGVPNAALVLESATRADAGFYTCHAGLAADATQLRVKDMYAALWPFLGICAEVFVLCAIILVYEKRRTKPELDDSDTDNHDQKKS